MNDTVKLIVNHETAVTDGHGDVWLPYLIQNGDGTVNRLGVIRRDALCDGRFGEAGDYDHASGTTCIYDVRFRLIREPAQGMRLDVVQKRSSDRPNQDSMLFPVPAVCFEDLQAVRRTLTASASLTSSSSVVSQSMQASVMLWP